LLVFLLSKFVKLLYDQSISRILSSLIFGGILIFGPIVRGAGNGSAGKISTNLLFA